MFVSLKLEGQSGVRTPDFRLCKQAPLTTAPGPDNQNKSHYLNSEQLLLLAVLVRKLYVKEKERNSIDS